MSIKIGINGFGRIGRLILRAAWDWPEVEFVQINDPAGDAATLAHLLTFDSVHGRWYHEASAEDNAIVVDGQHMNSSRNTRIEDTDWSGCDLIIEASGKMKKTDVLNAYLVQGVKRVVVTAPVKEPEALNVVMGVNVALTTSFDTPAVSTASEGVAESTVPCDVYDSIVVLQVLRVRVCTRMRAHCVCSGASSS